MGIFKHFIKRNFSNYFSSLNEDIVNLGGLKGAIDDNTLGSLGGINFNCSDILSPTFVVIL